MVMSLLLLCGSWKVQIKSSLGMHTVLGCGIITEEAWGRGRSEGLEKDPKVWRKMQRPIFNKPQASLRTISNPREYPAEWLI